MSRRTGPRLKLMRSVKTYLPGLGRKTIERKPYPPGQHRGASRKKSSVFGVQLIEKQKIKYHYGLTERQLRNLAAKAFKRRGDPGENLVKLLESRLDNLVWRAGYAPSIVSARQLVTHGHVRLDGKKVDKPGYLTRQSQKISVKEKSLSMPLIQFSLENPASRRPVWLAFDEQTKETTITGTADKDSIPFPVDLPKVIEFLSRAA